MIFYNSAPGGRYSFVVNQKHMKPFLSQILAMTLLIPGIAGAQTSNTNYKNNKNKEMNMIAIETNKEVIQNLYEQCLNKKNLALLKQFVSDDFTRGGKTKGVAAFEEPILPLFKAFPDIHWHVEDLISDGNKVAVRWKWQGTHNAQFNNFPATGKTITNEGMAVYELKDGKIINTQVQTDRLGFLQSLDVLPVDVSQISRKKAPKDAVNFIDKFVVPAAAIQEFKERVHINRTLIKTLPGFIEDAAYEYTDENGNLIYVTVASWQSRAALAKAKEAVQAEYKKQGFDMPGFVQRLHIAVDRGVYVVVQE